jgi:hypothetical protein
MDDADIKAASAANQSDGNLKPGAVHISGKQAHINHQHPMNSSSKSNASAEYSDEKETAGNINDVNNPAARKIHCDASNDVNAGGKINIRIKSV